MWDHLQSIAQLITALVLAFNCWQTYRNGQRAKIIKDDVAEIKVQTNGLNAKLLEVTGEAQFAKGVKQGEARSKVKS